MRVRPRFLHLRAVTWYGMALAVLSCVKDKPTEPTSGATKLLITTQPASSVVAGSPISMLVMVSDASGNPVVSETPSITITLGSSTPNGAALGGTVARTAANGVALFDDLSVSKAGTRYALIASVADGSLTSATSDSFTVTALPAAKLVMVSQPASVASLAAMSSVQVAVADVTGATVTSSAASVTITLTSGTGTAGAILGGTLTRSAVNGVATFDDLSVDKVGGNYTLTTNSVGLTSVTSGAFNVTPGAAAKLAYLVQPTDVTAAASINPSIQVAVMDASSNVVTTATSSVTLSITPATGGAGATLGGTATVAATGGIATFTGLSIARAGSAYTLSAASGTLTGAVSSAFNVSAGAPAKLAFVAQPGTSSAGSPLNPAVQVAVQDASGNAISTATNSVTVAITGGTGTASAVLSGTLARPAVAGTATFTDLSIDKAGSDYTLTASGTGLTSATSTSFAITIGSSSKLTLTTSAAGAASGAAFTTQPVVAVQDAAGATVTSDNSSVITMTVNGSGSVVGTATATAVAGVATFATVGVSGRADTTYTLTFSSSGLTSATQSISPTPGAATKLTLTTPAAGAPSGAAFATQPVVAVKDASNNTVTSDNSTVVTMTVNGSGGVVGTATATAASGVATFATVGVSGKADTTYTLTFAKSGLTSATQSISPTPGAAKQLVFTVQPPSGLAPSAVLTPSPQVTVQDSRGNTVTSASTSITLALVSNAAGAALGGTLTQSAVNGAATFNDLTLDKAGTGFTIGATATSLTSATSMAFSIVDISPAWIQFSPLGTPPAERFNHTSVYDATNDRMILFGGYTGTGGPTSFNDTWVLQNASGVNGTPSWTQLTTSGGPPPVRDSHTAVYDASNNRMIVYGGYGAGSGIRSDIWVLSNANGLGGTPTWSEILAPGGPAGRYTTSAVYDAANNRMTIFGGNVSETCSNDTWVLSNANGLGGTPSWSQLSPTGGPPPARVMHGAIYDAASNRTTIVWGRCSDAINSLWVLTRANGLGGTGAWSQLAPGGGSPTPRSGLATIYDAANQRVTTFGGSFGLGGATTNEVWVLSDAFGQAGTSTWTQLLPTGTAPAARYAASAVYSPTHNRMIVFGGTAAGGQVWVLTHANGLP